MARHLYVYHFNYMEWYKSEVKVTQSCLTVTFMESLGIYRPWHSPGQNTGVGSLSLIPEDLSDPGIGPGSSALHADSLPDELSGKPEWYKTIFLCAPKKKFNSKIEEPTLYYRRTSHTLYYVWNRSISITGYDLFWVLTFSISLLQKRLKMCQKSSHLSARGKQTNKQTS